MVIWGYRQVNSQPPVSHLSVTSQKHLIPTLYPITLAMGGFFQWNLTCEVIQHTYTWSNTKNDVWSNFFKWFFQWTPYRNRHHDCHCDDNGNGISGGSSGGDEGGNKKGYKDVSKPGLGEGGALLTRRMREATPITVVLQAVWALLVMTSQ